MTVEQTADRFIHFAAIESVAADATLSPRLVLRGAGMLNHFYGLPRPSADIDFIALDLTTRSPPSRRREIEGQVKSALSAGMRRHFPDFDAWRDRLRGTVQVQISPNQTVYEFHWRELCPGRQVQTLALEDLIAEKLTALLQQRQRERRRSQDVYDIAWLIDRHGSQINRVKVGDYFQRMVKARGDMIAQLSSFDDEIKCRSAANYDALKVSTGPSFIPFDHAWRAVLDFVSALPLRS